MAFVTATVKLPLCHLNPERCRCCCEPWKRICCGTWIFFWSAKCELLHDSWKDKKQHVSCQNLSKTHSFSNTKWDQPLILNKLAICTEEPLWSEHFRITPVFTIVQNTPNVHKNWCVLSNHKQSISSLNIHHTWLYACAEQNCKL